VHVLIRRKELFGFRVSLCKRAFCSGFVDHSGLFSPMIRVYSCGLSATARMATSHIQEITEREDSYVMDSQECDRYD